MWLVEGILVILEDIGLHGVRIEWYWLKGTALHGVWNMKLGEALPDFKITWLKCAWLKAYFDQSSKIQNYTEIEYNGNGWKKTELHGVWSMKLGEALTRHRF